MQTEQTFDTINAAVEAAKPEDKRKVLARELKTYKGADKEIIRAWLSEGIAVDTVIVID